MPIDFVGDWCREGAAINRTEGFSSVTSLNLLWFRRGSFPGGSSGPWDPAEAADKAKLE
jgi:hypothetical protein